MILKMIADYPIINKMRRGVGGGIYIIINIMNIWVLSGYYSSEMCRSLRTPSNAKTLAIQRFQAPSKSSRNLYYKTPTPKVTGSNPAGHTKMKPCILNGYGAIFYFPTFNDSFLDAFWDCRTENQYSDTPLTVAMH